MSNFSSKCMELSCYNKSGNTVVDSAYLNRMYIYLKKVYLLLLMFKIILNKNNKILNLWEWVFCISEIGIDQTAQTYCFYRVI